MAYNITDVQSYRFWNKSGTVIDMMTEEPKRFSTEGAAKSYASLSGFTGYKIVHAR